MESIGQRIARLRKLKGWSRPELGRQMAKASGRAEPFSGELIRLYEKGENEPGKEARRALAAVFDKDEAYIEFGRSTSTQQHPTEPRTLTAREEILLYLFGDLLPDQQREHIEQMKATFETNQALKRQMGGKALRFVSNAAIEANFGSVQQLQEPRKKYKAKRSSREPGTAMDDFLEGDPE